MKLPFLILSLLVYQSALCQGSRDTQISLTDLEGKWYINLSDFPMWLKGDKKNPSFNYSLTEKRNSIYLFDKVEFEKKGKVKSIVGYDQSLNEENTAFVWRGKGILKLLKSKWQIVEFDAEKQWMIIYFEKTLFTPKGYDVVSRNKNLSAADQKMVDEYLKQLENGIELSKINQE